MKKKTRPPEGATNPERPALLLELNAEGSLETIAWWPAPTTEEQADKLAGDYGLLLHLLSAGVFVPHLQHAVAVAGERDGMPQMARAILGYLHRYEVNRAAGKVFGEPAEDQLVVPPTEVFAT